MFYRRGAFAAINCDRNSLPTHEILRAEGESRPYLLDEFLCYRFKLFQDGDGFIKFCAGR